MPVRHELRSGKDRPMVDLDLSSDSVAPLEPLWIKNRYGSEGDEDSLYEPDWELTDKDLEIYVDISQKD